jgi:glycosyltransferase involved in cell wall biosynthesis
MLRAAVIIPALNEEESLGATLDRVPRSLFQTVIVADNGSTDRTAEIAREHGAIVVSEPERGYGAACLAALAAVPPDTEAVAFMQADSSEDPEEAALLLAPIAEGRADLVLGSRVMGRAERGSVRMHQAFGNRLATFLIRILFGYRYTDLGPFRAIRLESLRALGMRDRNYGWTVEMQIKALLHGLRVLEVPVSYRRRIAGEEKVSGNPIASVKAGTKILWTVAKLKAW